MSKILELREKRAKVWEAAKKFLDSKRGGDGLLSAEDTAAYEKMEKEVVDLGKEIERLERQAAIDAELNKPTSEPITNKPNNNPDGEEKTGRAADKYKRTFWNAMLLKPVPLPPAIILSAFSPTSILHGKKTINLQIQSHSVP